MTLSTLLFTLAQTPPAAPQPSLLSSIVPFIAIAVIFYFLIIRPQQKRLREQQALVASVKTGDHVIMNSGIHGIVANVKEATLSLKVADNVRIEFDKSAVASVSKSASEG